MLLQQKQKLGMEEQKQKGKEAVARIQVRDENGLLHGEN